MILYPYTDEHSVRSFSMIVDLIDNGAPIEIRRMIDDGAYWQFLNEYWNNNENLLIIEHDILPSRDQLLELERCQWDFCTIPYMIRGDRLSIWNKLDAEMFMGFLTLKDPAPNFVDGSGLGLVKLSRDRRIVDMDSYSVEKYKWWFLDAWLSLELKKIGHRWHVHWPMVEHDKVGITP